MMTDHELATVRILMVEAESLDISGIRDTQLARRVSAFQRRAGYQSTSDLVESLRKDRALRARFVDGLTINVTNFYRNADQWIRLRDEILPDLAPRVSMWSAGCSTGAEAYTMAMVAEEAGVNARILATDIDHGALATAAVREYPLDSIREVPDDAAQRHFLIGGTSVRVRPGLEKAIEFRRHDLLSDPLPGRLFDFIACRNVAIYFSDEAKHRLHSRLSAALRPGGRLLIGGAERISRPSEIGLEMDGPQFYKRGPA